MPPVESATLVATRLGLHQVAERVISPVRQRATGGRIALEPSPGGFSTQAMPGGGAVRVDGIELVVMAADGQEARAPLNTLREAGRFAGDPNADALPSEPLELDPQAAARLAEAFAGGHEALATLVGEAAPADDVSGIDLWPEHFDVAITLGAEATGERANYGVSPGDDYHPEPYAYVGPWAPPEGATADAGWNAVAFNGAELTYTDAETTLAFFRERREALRP